MTRPQCLALLICDDVIEDRRSGKKSLIGLFSTIMAQQLPTKRRFYLVASISGMAEYVPLEIKLESPDGGQVMAVKLDPPAGQTTNPYDVHDIVIELPDLEFALAGRYAFQVWDTEGLLAQRYFHVVKAVLEANKPVAQG